MNEWISVKDRLPEAEQEVFIVAVSSNGYQKMTTAMYENGKIKAEDSNWHWTDIDFDYNDEEDCDYVPEGWWEYRHFNGDDVYNNAIYDKVTHWQPLPEPPKADAENESKGMGKYATQLKS